MRQDVSSGVLDASALLALLNAEPGSDTVVDVIARGAAISAVNLAEVVGKLAEAGMPENEIRNVLEPLDLQVVDHDWELAFRTGMLRPATRAAGLSLGDRACLALALDLGLPAWTADHSWEDLRLGVEIRTIRALPTR